MKLTPPATLEYLASFLNSDYEGPANHMIEGINEIHCVEKGDITFVDHPKYYSRALKSKATTVIINKRVEVPPGKGLIYCDDPFDAYIKIIRKYSSFEPASKRICDSAVIGEGTIIQPGVFIGNKVIIGTNCLIHSNVSIYDGAVIGNNVVIHANSVIGADAFYFKRKPEQYSKMVSCGNVQIDDDVEIGANCCIDRGVSAITKIGKGTKIDNLVQIGHDTIVGKNCIFAAQVGIAGTAVIEDDVILWGQVGVSKDLTIGKGSVVYAQSGVAGSLKPGGVYFGSPAIDAKEKIKEIKYMRKLPELFNK